MVPAADSRTSPTLLRRLRDEPMDQAAWAEFVERYAPKVYDRCRQWKLQEADAEDVTQMVLARLAERMRTFAYDPGSSFRGWLRTLTRHAWSDFVRHRARAGRGQGGGQVDALLQSVEAGDGLVAQLEEQFDREVLDEATARVRLRVDPRTFEAFRLTAVEGLSGAEAGQRLDMRVAAVFKNRSRVQKLLQDEVRRLEGTPP
jgi:RNA polymerase sigma-70 factor (ECF subfamily)